MHCSGIVLAIFLLVSLKSHSDPIDSSYFSLTLPKGWDIQHEERRGQLGAKIGNATNDGYPSPWIMMEYCIKSVDSKEGSAPKCQTECPANPFDYLAQGDNSDLKLSKVRKVITPNQTKYLASHQNNKTGSILLMASCSSKGIASIFIFSENSVSNSLNEFGGIIDSFQWK